MKSKVQIAGLLVWFLCLGSSFYDIHFPSLQDYPIAMEFYKGKKVVIFSFNCVNVDSNFLRKMDKLQEQNVDKLAIIGIPAKEYNSSIDQASLSKLSVTLAAHLLLTKPSSVKKTANALQHPLMKWLTDSSQNKHFIRDVDEDGQMFVVSGAGELSAVLNKRFTDSLLNVIIAETK